MMMAIWTTLQLMQSIPYFLLSVDNVRSEKNEKQKFYFVIKKIQVKLTSYLFFSIVTL